jgi:DNA-binding MarR family transcriptional regulator
VAGPHTLAETERAAESHIAGLDLDIESMHVISNLFRAANAVRNHMERVVLTPADLTWTAFVVLWVTWIWDNVETRVVAEETGVSKATLSGVLATLERRGLLRRTKSDADGRLVLVSLTPSGKRLIMSMFPKINAEETLATSLLPKGRKEDTAEMLRLLVLAVGENKLPSR